MARESFGQVYAALDFLVVTSSVEGFPFVALEPTQLAAHSQRPQWGVCAQLSRMATTASSCRLIVPWSRQATCSFFLVTSSIFGRNARQSVQQSPLRARVRVIGPYSM